MSQANGSLTKKPVLALINPQALPALRIAGTIFLVIYLLGGWYIFRNRHRFFDKDPDVPEDIPAIRKIRIELVLLIWCALTTLIIFTIVQLWRD